MPNQQQEPRKQDQEPQEPQDPRDGDPKQEPGGGEPKAEPKGGPSWQMAAEGYRAERDAYKQQVADLTAQVEQLRTSLEGAKSADDVQAAIDSALTEANGRFEADRAKWAEREKGLLVANALAEAGCIDSTAAAAHVDLSQVGVGEDGSLSGLDVDALRGSYPYLFGQRQNPGSTGGRPDGPAESDDALERVRAQFGLGPEKG